jgi:hypothetical protein
LLVDLVVGRCVMIEKRRFGIWGVGVGGDEWHPHT